MTAPVHVAGWGATTALGYGVPVALEALAKGGTGPRPARFSPHLAPTPGEPLPVFEVPDGDADLSRRARRICSSALDEALAMAGDRPGTIGVFAGTTGGFSVDGEYALLDVRANDPSAWPPYLQRGPGELAAWVGDRLGATGPLATFTTACTSSGIALASATRHLRAGTCDRAVVVGFDMLQTLSLHGFRSLLLVDARPSRPFDATRNGLQLGEGCGVLVLDRGGHGPFVMAGEANVLSAAHLTSTATDGSTAEAVMASALQRSGLAADDVASVKAHGTGTRDNDLAEGLGMARLFGDRVPPFASLKGAIGHTLGAAGAVEAALWLGALRAGFLPASAGFSEPDPELGVAPLRASVPAPRGAHLLNAFGFGGSCVAQVVCDA